MSRHEAVAVHPSSAKAGAAYSHAATVAAEISALLMDFMIADSF